MIIRDCLSDNTCGNGVKDDHLPLNRVTAPGVCLVDGTTQDTGCAEVCDDGNQESGDGCSANCLSEEQCLNGIRDPLGNGSPTGVPPNPPELCDDGNTVDTDTCQGGSGCGNGLLDPRDRAVRRQRRRHADLRRRLLGPVLR